MSLENSLILNIGHLLFFLLSIMLLRVLFTDVKKHICKLSDRGMCGPTADEYYFAASTPVTSNLLHLCLVLLPSSQTFRQTEIEFAEMIFLMQLTCSKDPY